MHLPSVKQLRYFTALVEHKHFGRAAAACFVSQSAFSLAIQELEALLKVQLVDRTNKRVAITRIGEEVAVQARLSLRDIEAVVETAHAQTEPLAGNLRMGVIPTIAPFMLPKIMPGLRKQFPRLDLWLREDQTQRLYAALLTGDIDLMLYAEPYDLSGVTSQTLFDEGFVLAYHQGTQLVDPSNYRFNRLNAASVLLLEEGHCLRDHAISACKIRDFGKVTPFSASSLLTLVQMVDSDLGVTFLPDMAVNSSLLRGTKIKTTTIKEKSRRTIALAWRKSSARGDEFRQLGEFIEGIAAQR